MRWSKENAEEKIEDEDEAMMHMDSATAYLKRPRAENKLFVTTFVQHLKQTRESQARAKAIHERKAKTRPPEAPKETRYPRGLVRFAGSMWPCAVSNKTGAGSI